VSVDQNGRRLGAGATRNRALVRAQADLVAVLDADDLMLPDALPALAEALTEHGFLLVFGRGRDLLADGHRVNRPEDDLAPGILEPGALEGTWRRNLVVPEFRRFLVSKALLLAYGGWGALTSNENGNALFSMSLHRHSLYVDRDVALYRRHPRQMTAGDYFYRHRQQQWDFVHQRLSAMRALAGRTIPEGWETAPRCPPREEDPLAPGVGVAARVAL
jgi:glycosyltransferase involved in cell wall biosynthesis